MGNCRLTITKRYRLLLAIDHHSLRNGHADGRIRKKGTSMNNFINRIRKNREVGTNVIDLFKGRQRTEKVLIDPLESSKIKEMLARYYASGARRISLTTSSPKKSYENDFGCWADDLPRDLRLGYGLYAPATNLRMPRVSENHKIKDRAVYMSPRNSRYSHILIAAWANDLPLTEQIWKNLLDPYFSNKFDETKEIILKIGLATEEKEDWHTKKSFYGKSAQGPHFRPTREALYTHIESVVFLYDSIKSVFNDLDDEILDLFDIQNWVSASDPMPKHTTTFKQTGE
tara:strand:+ start:1477 stop:2334 length:858 start_codon:yes stop_codon:yes gene_type:complete